MLPLKTIALLLVLSCSSVPNSTPTDLVFTGTISDKLIHNGIERDYILYVPDGYTGEDPLPLVFNFHGYTSNARDQMNYGDFRPLAEREGFIVVHPQGELLEGVTHWNVGGWTLASEMDDVGFTEALIDKISEDYNIDDQRIYATGMSNGGYMSFLLACQLSERFAAVASVTGSMTPQTYSACDPSHPMPVLQIHGTADETVPYEGNPFWTHSIEEVLDYWIGFNNCNATADVTPFEDSPIEDGSTVEQILYEDGDEGAVVVHFKVDGGGHTWPGALEGLPATNYDIEATEFIWGFFKLFDLDGRVE